MQSIVIKPNGRIDKPWSLVIRTHDLGGTDYHTLAHLTDSEARAIAGETVQWLFGEPDWEKLERDREVERLKREITEKQNRLNEIEPYRGTDA